MQVFNIDFTEQQLHTVGRALSLLPYAEVFNLINEINKQVSEQMKPPEEGEGNA